MSQSRNKFDLISAVRSYVDKMISDAALEGMKVLLLDSATTRIVSMVYSQTQILDKEVYLVELLGKEHLAMNHLKAVIFVQPTESNYDLIARELKDPKFKEYHLFFSNVVTQDMLTRLARQDEHDLVMQVNEYYMDFMAVNRDLFHLGIENSLILSSNMSRTLESSAILEKNLSGLSSVLLALKKIPSVIRYQYSSEVCRRCANDLLSLLGKTEIFDFPRSESTLLLIVDRKDDPVTPLLTQWTYQAMVHELLGLNCNRVILRGAPNVPEDMQEVVLSGAQDEFFAKNYLSNFGDLGSSVKSMLDEYQKHSKKNENISSIEDMQNFLERYPDFRAKSINITKHVTVISELSRLVDVCKLLDISELEQEIACSSDHNNHKMELMQRIRSTTVKNADKLRLSLLYLLKYESYDEIREIKSALGERGISASNLGLLDAILEYAGESKRTPGLFAGQGIFAKISNTFSNVEGVQNVYTQHQPLLSQTLANAASGKIKDSQYPSLVFGGGNPPQAASRPTEIIVFIIGGATYEEAARVTEFNNNNSGMRVYLGGSCILNSKSFLDEVQKSFAR
jgi:vacuolar protein sorting-associated protein 45